MKKLDAYLSEEISKTNLSSILGCIDRPTSMEREGHITDTHHDNNNDGIINGGDSITFHDCPQQ